MAQAIESKIEELEYQEYLNRLDEDEANFERQYSAEHPDEDYPGRVHEERHCERCQTLTGVELIPLMGYSEYLCAKCAAAAYRSGQAV